MKLLHRIRIWFLVRFFPARLIESVVDDRMTNTVYVWREGRYSIGVDVAARGDWSAAILIKEHRDGTMEVIGEKRWKSGTPASEMADPFPGAIWTCKLCGAEGTGPRMFCPICYYPCCGECRDQHLNEYHGAGLHTEVK